MGAVRWIIDGNNVMGAGADGWWNDPPAAAARLAQQVAEWCRTHDHDVTLVFDGRPVGAVAAKAGGRLAIEFAPRAGRGAADDRIVELVEELFVDPDLLRRHLRQGTGGTTRSGSGGGRLGGLPAGSTGAVPLRPAAERGAPSAADARPSDPSLVAGCGVDPRPRPLTTAVGPSWADSGT